MLSSKNYSIVISILIVFIIIFLLLMTLLVLLSLSSSSLTSIDRLSYIKLLYLVKRPNNDYFRIWIAYLIILFIITVIRADKSCNLSGLVSYFPWLTGRLVCKSDEMFSKRAEKGLVLLDVDLNTVTRFINEKTGPYTVNDVRGQLEYFIVEPFIEHTKEYYLSFESTRSGVCITFSHSGGTGVEHCVAKVHTVDVSIDDAIPQEKLGELFSELLPEEAHAFADFTSRVYTVFNLMDMTFFESNPVTIRDGVVRPLDLTVELDTAAFRRHTTDWEALSFPPPFGSFMHPEELEVAELSRNSSSSFHLSVLNKEGRMHLVAFGAGAALALSDYCVCCGLAQEIGSITEMSGNPSEEEYCRITESLVRVTRSDGHYSGSNKALVFVGGMASHTDLLLCFKGLGRGLCRHAAELRRNNVWVFVRRSGSNWERARQHLADHCRAAGVALTIVGPEMGLAAPLPLAAQWISGTKIDVMPFSPPVPTLEFWEQKRCTCSCFPCCCKGRSKERRLSPTMTAISPMMQSSVSVNSLVPAATLQSHAAFAFDGDEVSIPEIDPIMFPASPEEGRLSSLDRNKNTLKMKIESAKLKSRVREGETVIK